MKKKRGKKKNPRGRRPRVTGTRYKCVSGYVIYINIIGPYVFSELRQKFNIDRPQFTQELFVKETGATLIFPYTPPKTVPDRDEDIQAWTIYHQYLEWVDLFDKDLLQYQTLRVKLLLTLAVTVHSHSDGRSIRKELASGDWIKDLSAGEIQITAANRFYFYLITKVLIAEADFLTVLDLATAEEVTLEDVLRSFEYFQTVLAQSEFSQDLPELTQWGKQLVNEPVGSADGN